MSKGPGADWAFSDCFQKLYTYSPRQAQISIGGRIRSQNLRRNPGPKATGYIHKSRYKSLFSRCFGRHPARQVQISVRF